MDSAWIGIIGTLLGGLLGAGSSYWLQRDQSQKRWDETKRRLFRDYLTAVQAARTAAEDASKRCKDDVRPRYVEYLDGPADVDLNKAEAETRLLIAHPEALTAMFGMQQAIVHYLSASDPNIENEHVNIEEAYFGVLEALRKELRLPKLGIS